MANRDIVDGAKPYGPCLRARPYQAGGTVYPGDLLKFSSGGQVVAGTAGAACMGVALTYATSGVDVIVMQVAADEVDAQTDINQNASLIAGSPNTTYRRSGMELDGSTLATTATLELKIIRLLPAVDNALGANAKLIVKINNHQLGSHTGTAGV
jgi:hypothetical protein